MEKQMVVFALNASVTTDNQRSSRQMFVHQKFFFLRNKQTSVVQWERENLIKNAQEEEKDIQVLSKKIE